MIMSLTKASCEIDEIEARLKVLESEILSHLDALDALQAEHRWLDMEIRRKFKVQPEAIK